MSLKSTSSLSDKGRQRKFVHPCTRSNQLSLGKFVIENLLVCMGLKTSKQVVQS